MKSGAKTLFDAVKKQSVELACSDEDALSLQSKAAEEIRQYLQKELTSTEGFDRRATTDKIHLPCFADTMMTIDHTWDPILAEKHGRMKLEQQPADSWDSSYHLKHHTSQYNPQPGSEEKESYDLKLRYRWAEHLNFFLRNNLFTG